LKSQYISVNECKWHASTVSNITFSDRRNSTRFQVGLNMLKPFKINFECFSKKHGWMKMKEIINYAAKNILSGLA